MYVCVFLQELVDGHLVKMRQQEEEIDRLRQALSSKPGGKRAGRSPADVRKIKVGGGMGLDGMRWDEPFLRRRPLILYFMYFFPIFGSCGFG